jgi:hypothetical protein
MKKLLFGIVSVLSTFGLSAQEKANDTLKIKWRHSKIWIFDNKELIKKDSLKKQKKDFTHWAGIDVGISTLTTIDNKLKISEEQDTMQMNYFLDLNYGKSLFLSLNLLEKHVNLYKNYALILTGLGVEWSNYDFKRNITLNPNASYISASNTVIAPSNMKFSVNKLKATYLKIPLIVELNSNTKNPDRSFHISGGMEFAYRISTKTKQVYELNGYEYKVKRRDDYHLADFKYSSVLRLGYGNYFTLFANYSLSELFERDNGPHIYPFTAGISLSF